MSKAPIRVCLVAPFPPPYGGIAHWTSMVCRYAAGRRDAEIVLVNTAPTWRTIHSNGVMLRALGGGIQLIRDVLRLVGALRRSRFDVVHLTTSGHLAAIRDLAVSYVASLFKVPLVYHIRFGRIPDISRANSLEWRLMRKVMRRAASVIAIDNATLAAVREHAAEANVCLVPNCVNTTELPVPEPVLEVSANTIQTALFVGWVVPTKGVGELVEAWATLNPPGWRLDIVGPADEAYKAQLQARFDTDSIVFSGPLLHKDAMDRMARCDLFVLPSYTEGFPNAVVEAMALGRPIIATAVGAIPEMLGSGAGILVESRSVGRLGEALRRATSDSSLRRKLAQEAFGRAVKNYSIDVVFDSYLALWSGVSVGSREAVS